LTEKNDYTKFSNPFDFFSFLDIVKRVNGWLRFDSITVMVHL
jgi:hypothetical protein